MVARPLIVGAAEGRHGGLPLRENTRIGGTRLMDKPKITFSTNPNPRNRALIDGLVPIDGYDLEYVGDKYTPGEMHYRFTQGEFDLAEMSTATLMRIKEKGQRFRALPVFFQRGPRQRNIFYSEGKLNHPSELKGKQIGCFRYGATAVSWARGFLLDEYDIKTTNVSWFVSGKEVFIGNELQTADRKSTRLNSSHSQISYAVFCLKKKKEKHKKTILQNAIDSIFDNGRRVTAGTVPGNRPIDYITDMLKGNQFQSRTNHIATRCIR